MKIEHLGITFVVTFFVGLAVVIVCIIAAVWEYQGALAAIGIAGAVLAIASILAIKSIEELED